MYDWEIMMNIDHTQLHRARYFSLHTIAAVTGRVDLNKLVSEMRESDKVLCLFCTVVRSIVFCLKEKNKQWLSETQSWDDIDNFLIKYPYPSIKGFMRARGEWAGGDYGLGEYKIIPNAMSEPFIKEDYLYANTIIDALKHGGYEPAIIPY